MRGASLLLAVSLLAADASAGVVELISRAATVGDTGGGFSNSPSFSADSRYVVFASIAPNLAPAVLDLNGKFDIYLFDRLAGSTILVSASSADHAIAANGESTLPVISADGRYVAYQSTATDLVPGQIDSNGKTDVFLFDRIAGSTTLVSHAASSALGTGSAASENAAMSGDGRYVAFQSVATNLVTGQVSPPPSANVFLWDRTTGTILLVSHSKGSTVSAGNSESRFPMISADGTTIVFFSFASDLVTLQGLSTGAVYSFDVSNGSVALLSHAAGSATTTPNSTTDAISISADARFVGLRSNATNLVSGQAGAPGLQNVYLYDRTLDSTVLMSRKAGFPSTASNGFSDFCKVSADGKFVAFISTSSDLVSGFVDANAGSFDVYLYDRLADSVSLVNRRQVSPSQGADGSSVLSNISADGRWIAFTSRGTDVVTGQTGATGLDNAFIYDRLSGTSRLASHVPGSLLAACNFHSFALALSADGGFFILGSFATDVQAGVVDNNGTSDLFLFDVGDGSNTLITRRALDEPNVSGDDYSTYSADVANALSDDGRFVAYVSRATNLAEGQSDVNSIADVFLADRLLRKATLVSHAAASPTTTGNGGSFSTSVSSDGRWVAFSSRASDLVAGIVDTAGHADVLLYDRLSATNILVSSSSPATGPANGDSSSPIVSRDGRFVVFSSVATDLVAGQNDANSSSDVFLYDRVAGVTTLVSHAAGSTLTTGNGFSSSARMSVDGNFVAFVSGATNLAGGQSGAFLFERSTGLVTFVGPADLSLPLLLAISDDGNWVAFVSVSQNVFLFDRVSGTSTLASHNATSSVTGGNRASSRPSLSADGRFLAFASNATDLVAGVSDSNAQQDVFLFDRADGTIRLVSAASGGSQATSNGGSGGQVVSADGSRVAFVSNATNLVPGQASSPAFYNVFLFSRVSGTSILASGSMGSATQGGNDDTYPPEYPVSLSANGRVVAFASYASDLVPGDFNRINDMFAFHVDYSAPAALFNTLTPCRVIDTRDPAGPFGGPALTANGTRAVTLAGRCGIPFDAVAVSANVTVVGPAADGTLSLYPAGFTAGGTSTVSYRAGQTRASNAILGLGAGGATAAELASPGAAHLVIDVNGYFR